MSFNCMCGHRVHDEPTDGQTTLGYMAHALPDRHLDLVQEVAPAAITAYLEARAQGQETAWLTDFFTADYAALQLDPATIVLDILAGTVQRAGAVQRVWQCESCQRLWVSDAVDPWRLHGFVPMASDSGMVFDRPAPR